MFIGFEEAKLYNINRSVVIRSNYFAKSLSGSEGFGRAVLHIFCFRMPLYFNRGSGFLVPALPN
jgi:hypothetical protein